MPTFKYTAIDLTGKKIKGILSSASERAARQQIKAGNLTPLSLGFLRIDSKESLESVKKMFYLLQGR